MKKKIGPIGILRANARNLLALCCLSLLASASLLLPRLLTSWQNQRILGVFQPQPQQQAEPSASRLGLEKKLDLLSGGVFYNGLQSYFSAPLPYWLDLDYNYAAIEEDYQAAVETAANITISPLLTGSRYTPESALSQCWGQLDRLTALGLLSPVDRENPWDVSIQPLLYLSRSSPSHSLIVWQIRLRQGDSQLWVSLDDDSGLILYLQHIYDPNVPFLVEINGDPMSLWAQYWGVELQDCSLIHFADKLPLSQYTAVYLENGRPFSFSAQFTPNFCTFGALVAEWGTNKTPDRPGVEYVEK